MMKEVLKEADLKRAQRNKAKSAAAEKNMKKPKGKMMFRRKEKNHVMLK